MITYMGCLFFHCAIL